MKMTTPVSRVLGTLILAIILSTGAILGITLQIPMSSAATGDATHPSDIQDLSDQAYLLMLEGKWNDALLVIDRLENLLKQSNNDAIQPDILYNQAIVHYHLEHYPESMAALRQLMLYQNSEQAGKLLDQIQHLIEMRAYEKNPTATFIQGYSNNYLSWDWSHSFSHPIIHLVLFLTSILCCASLTCYFVFRENKSVRILLGIFIAYLVVFYSFICILHIIRFNTDDYEFAILLRAADTHTEPDFNSPPAVNASLLEGVTLQIMSTNDTWALVECSDGASFWIPKDHLYQLRVP